jgi:hypothetical protein
LCCSGTRGFEGTGHRTGLSRSWIEVLADLLRDEESVTKSAGGLIFMVESGRESHQEAEAWEADWITPGVRVGATDACAGCQRQVFAPERLAS